MVQLERVYRILLAVGYPDAGIDWLRRHRLATIVLLAGLSWIVLLVGGWLLLSGASVLFEIIVLAPLTFAEPATLNPPPVGLLGTGAVRPGLA